jgi:hypothetical protein
MILGDGTKVRMGNTYGQGEVGDKRGSKEMDRCPLTVAVTERVAVTLVMTTVAVAVMALIEVAVTERAAAVYRRGRWFVSNVSDVRTMWNITALL